MDYVTVGWSAFGLFQAFGYGGVVSDLLGQSHTGSFEGPLYELNSLDGLFGRI